MYIHFLAALIVVALHTLICFIFQLWPLRYILPV